MTVCVRYAEELETKERFLGFVDCSEVANADAIHGHVKQFLEGCGLYSLPIVAQCYDGAAVMSGHVSGVQAQLLGDHPSPIYIHCMAHKLNLVLVDTCEVNRTANGYFLTLESLYTFFTQPGTHHAYKKAQEDIGATKEITALSNTRWACR
ncbi:zinc finger MYM-type protein 1-like [Scomber scombrus]|uniref:Zinc finger MYM-type protein 1-like n=1 Tax=Scomber scombrus TaxID=13677 RepID=A0AAV1NZY2_SCOSC